MTCIRRPLAFLQERFRAKTEPGPNGCILWIGAVDTAGYGVFTCWPEGEPAQRVRKAHQWAFEWAWGPIPEGHETDHICKVRNCVNPDHLRPLTRQQNLKNRVWPESQAMRSRIARIMRDLPDDVLPDVLELVIGLRELRREEVA